MEDKKYRRPTKLPLALSGGFDGRQPPGGGGTGRAVAATPQNPTLTPIFNAAANPTELSAAVKQPISKQQIEAMRRKLSQPRLTFDMNPLGGVNRYRNAKADRILIQAMTAMTEQLAKSKGVSKTFALAEKKGQLKQEFNKSSLGRGR